MGLVSFQEWLSISNKTLWVYDGVEHDSAGDIFIRCTAFGTTLKQVFRNLGRKLLTMHRRFEAHGDLVNGVRINCTDNSIVILEANPQPGSTLIQKMEADVDAFITMFNAVCDENSPTWDRQLDLPPDAIYLRQVYNFLSQRPKPTIPYKGFRFMEFWILNYSGFLSLGQQQNFFHVLYDIERNDPILFNCYMTLQSPPDTNVLRDWPDRMFLDNQNFLDEVYDHNPTNPGTISCVYRTPKGLIDFARNCHNYSGHHCQVNRIQIVTIIQNVFPELLGKIHYELCTNFPPNFGSGDLYSILVNEEPGEQRIYTWG